MADSFPDEVERATHALRSFSTEAERGAKGQARREQEKEQRSALGRVLGGLSGAFGSAGGLAPAASVYGAVGSVDDAADVASAGLVDSFGRAFPLVTGGLGVEKERRSFENARGEVFDGLQDLARYNVPISDDFLQKVIDTKVAQHERIQEFQARVTAKTAYTPADAISGAVGEDRMAVAFEKFADTLEGLRRLLESMPLLSGGSPR